MVPGNSAIAFYISVITKISFQLKHLHLCYEEKSFINSITCLLICNSTNAFAAICKGCSIHGAANHLYK